MRLKPTSQKNQSLKDLLRSLSGLCHSYRDAIDLREDSSPFQSFVKQITSLLAQTLRCICFAFPQNSAHFGNLFERFCHTTTQLTSAPVPSKLRRYQLSEKKEKRASSVIPEVQCKVDQEDKDSEDTLIYQPTLNRFSSTVLGDFSPNSNLKHNIPTGVVFAQQSDDFTGPTFVCRICEEIIPVLNEESHTNFCSQRRDILDCKRKEVGDALFKAYTDLRKLLSKKREQRAAERSKSFSINVFDQTIVSGKQGCNTSQMKKLKQSVSQVIDNQTKTCESEDDDTSSFQQSMKSTLQPDNSYLEKVNSSFEILIEHLGASVKSQDIEEPERLPLLSSTPSCESDGSIASQPREQNLGYYNRKKKESQKSQFLKQKLSSQKVNDGSSSEENDIVIRRKVTPFLQSFKVGKKIQKLKLQRARQLSPLIKSAREGDAVKSSLSTMKEDLLKRTMSQTMMNTPQKTSNSFRALASLTKLAKTCFICNIAKETSVGVLQKALHRVQRYLDKYGFSREERKALTSLRDNIKQKYDLAVMLCQLERKLENTKLEDSFQPWDEQCTGRRNSRTGMRFHLTHKRSKSENSSNKKSKKGKQRGSRMASPRSKKREDTHYRDVSISPLSKAPDACEVERTKLTREQEAIESIYQEDESFSPRKDDNSFEFDTIFQINRIPPKDLTIVPEEAKMVSSTCMNEPIEFLRIQSVQEGQLAALNFADPQHRRLNSLNLLDRKSSDSPEKKLARATTTNFKDWNNNIEDGELTPSFSNFKRVNHVEVIDELLQELDPCEKKEETPASRNQTVKLTIKPIPIQQRRSSGSKARSISAQRYLRLRRSVAPDSLSDPGVTHDISETRLSENWTDMAPFLSQSAGFFKFDSDSEQENGSLFKREGDQWEGRQKMMSSFELQCEEMKDKFSEIGPIAYQRQVHTAFCGTDLIRQLEGKKDEKGGHYSFCIQDQSETQGDSSSLQQSLNLSKCQSMEFTPSMLESVRSMEPSKVSINNFKIIKRLSHGAYGDVVLAEQKKSKDLFAVKIMNVKEVVKKNQLDFLSTEKEILNSVSSDYVVHGAYSFKDENYFYIAMEYMPGGDLASLLEREGRFEWEQARFYLMEIVQALEYLRSMNYIHRDLKPDNILLDKKGHIKLTDFGLSKAGLLEKKKKLRHNFAEDWKSINTQAESESKNCGSRKRSVTLTSTANFRKSQDQRILGTPNYMAPEVVEGKKDHSFSLDYWSLGVIAYELIVGAFPFLGDNVKELFSHILKGNVEYPEICEDIWTEATDDFIKRLLDPNPETRLGAKDIQEIKDHPFFKGVDWNNRRSLEPPFFPSITSLPKANEGESELTWSTYLKGGKRRSGGKKRSTINSNLEPVMEEGAQSHFRDWDSQNFKYLKLLNHKEALKKIASIKPRRKV